MKRVQTLVPAAILISALGASALAEDAKPAPPPVPFVIPYGHKDASLAPSGTYTLDPNHVGIIARVSHLDFSISVFRFDRASATLEWNREAPSKSKLTASVETGSIASNVAGFAAQLAGPEYLKSATYPQASFVSTAFHQIDATHGTVVGQFTLMGKTESVTFDVELIGAGPGFAGSPVMGHVIGIEARTKIDPQDFLSSPFFKTPIEIVIDTEFDLKR